METRERTLSVETDALRELYAALNRNDIPAIVKIFDPQVERIEPSDSPGQGIYRGLAAVQAHFSQARGSWAEGNCETERFIVHGDKIVVFVHVHVRVKNETEWREGHVADVYRFQNGKVVETRLFLNRQEALEWTGVES